MRPSRVLQLLRAGKTASCFKVNLHDPQVAELAAMAGFDCLWVDLEHQGRDWAGIAASIWAAKAHQADVMVRVARGGYSEYIRALELDATGILVPHVMSLQDAQELVRITRFHPVGRRPLDGGNADGGYTRFDMLRYMEHANRERFVIFQIEDPEPMEELDAIAALEGYDMLFFGPGDFSQGIGAPGQWDHPRLAEARRQVAAAARRHGKFAATVGGPGNLQELFDMGYQFVNVGADVVGLNSYCQQLLAAFHNTQAPGKGNSYLEP
ncbi:HpcH/HpaI aldolase family protein [Chitinophaga alhagiae]|nr:aldolase/citrate lyase family protein [Chitinophaga alhagiae]